MTRKVNAKGRSTSQHGGAMKRFGKIEDPFAPLTLPLLESEAWKSLSANGYRFISRLMLEHIHHGGYENGRLVVTYKQLEEYGLSRNCIRDAITECEVFGLVETVEVGGMDRNIRKPSKYRITFLFTESAKPTDEWRRVTAQKIQAFRDRQRKDRLSKKRRRKSDGATRKVAGSTPPDLRVVR